MGPFVFTAQWSLTELMPHPGMDEMASRRASTSYGCSTSAMAPLVTSWPEHST